MNTQGEGSVVVPPLHGRFAPSPLGFPCSSFGPCTVPVRAPALAVLRPARPPVPAVARRSARGQLTRYARAWQSASRLPRSPVAPPRFAAPAARCGLPLPPLRGRCRFRSARSRSACLRRAPRSRPRRGWASPSRSARRRSPLLPGLRASLLHAGGAQSARAGRARVARPPFPAPRARAPGVVRMLWRRQQNIGAGMNGFGRAGGLRPRWRFAPVDKASLCSGRCGYRRPSGIHAARLKAPASPCATHRTACRPERTEALPPGEREAEPPAPCLYRDSGP